MFKPQPVRRDMNAWMASQGNLYSAAMASANFPEAIHICEGVLRVIPKNLTVISDFALALMRDGQYQKAYRQYLKIHAAAGQGANTNWRDGLAEVCGWLNKPDELQRYGLEALTLSDRQWRDGKKYPYPAAVPPAFEVGKKQKNILSYSLYGASPRYCETMVKNAELALELYPHWTCRVYLDNSVPEHVVTRLKHHDVEVMDVTGKTDIAATMWRFLVMDDKSVTRFIVRDADSLISEKEVAAVDAWLASPYWFHHMRDYFTHTDLLLAGMWGGCNGVFENVESLMRDYVKSYEGKARYTDQMFLKAALWPTVRESLLSHDELFHFHDAQPYPPHPPVRWDTSHFHIGSNVGYSAIVGHAADSSADSLKVVLKRGEEQADYQASVHNAEWQLNVPFFIIEEISKGEVEVTV